ncbi:hypothetical protein GCK32_004070, partial [Trichostrongylus colubriformis]
GPMLRIVNNPQLEFLDFGKNFVSALKGVSGKPVLVHGNMKLDQTVMKNLSRYHFIDIQEHYGECMLPNPLTSLQQISTHNCSLYYGSLLVDPKLTTLKMPMSMSNKYDWIGCIHIENTKLKDVNFLRIFRKFTLIRGCKHTISGNKDLCLTEELNFLYRRFTDLRVYNNKESCQRHCLGGLATEDYLKNIGSCTYIHGDLIISDWKEKPPYVQMLRNIKHIKGRLIIRNNKNLGVFDYLSNLETVNRSTQESNNKHGSKDEAYTVESMEYGEDGRLKYILITLGIIVVVALVFIVLIILLLFLRSTMSKRTFTLPLIPSSLSKKSKQSLSSMSKEVVSKDPTSWSSSDQEMLWSLGVQGRSGAGADVGRTQKKPSESLRAFMIPLAANARLPFPNTTGYDKLLLHRIGELLKYDYVIMIGSGGDICKIVPRLPSNIGVLSMYIDNRAGATYSFKLVEAYHLSRRTIYYKYEVRDVNKYSTKIMHALHYTWCQERLPTEFDELLQIIQLCSNRKAICVSDRRKEVFSIIHLIFKSVLAGEDVNLVELFQFHLKNCNGSPLDRDEMLFVLRTVIRWSQVASCVLPEDKEVNNWCQSYTQIASFARTHPNVRNIRPEYLLSDNEQIPRELQGTMERTFEEHGADVNENKIEYGNQIASEVHNVNGKEIEDVSLIDDEKESVL